MGSGQYKVEIGQKYGTRHFQSIPRWELNNRTSVRKEGRDPTYDRYNTIQTTTTTHTRTKDIGIRYR